ncbi:hypothetical protein HHK36_028231 [Tetracentron sinense]|uniref:CS domain-containing protein n=1 Tax=Tetracentron sinense TaxID=13715 RepID=A0A835D494_TETSI|nr:hypothetical protein HHK36_028231 [Tetracentron sinense]
MASSLLSTLCFSSQNPLKSLELPLPKISLCNSRPNFAFKKNLFSPKPSFLSYNIDHFKRFGCVSCKSTSTISINTRNYEFSDGFPEVELRLQLGGRYIQSSRDIFVDADESSLKIKVQCAGSLMTLIEINNLYEKIKPAETIWYIDEDQLVVNLKKHDPDLKWPDVVESWESLTIGIRQLLKGTSIYIVGNSTEINQKVARELAVGLGYTPLTSSELLEAFAKQTIDSYGVESVAEAEGSILESLSSHVRAVVATLGGQHGAAVRADKWRHLYAGFTVWLSQSEATDIQSELVLTMVTFRNLMAWAQASLSLHRGHTALQLRHSIYTIRLPHHIAADLLFTAVLVAALLLTAVHHIAAHCVVVQKVLQDMQDLGKSIKPSREHYKEQADVRDDMLNLRRICDDTNAQGIIPFIANWRQFHFCVKEMWKEAHYLELPHDVKMSWIFTVTVNEDTTKDEAQRHIQEGSQAYSNADVVVKLGGWNANLAQTVAQASLSALKRVILSDKKLPGKKSLYIRLGCRGDWPNIKPPGWDPSTGV